MIRNLDPLSLLISIPALLLAITFHELAHGLAADRLGDPTPRSYGRLSLNPIKHLDLFGGLALLLVGFGWAKPVPINPAYFQDRKKGTAIVGLAGPFANIILAFVAMLVFKLIILNPALSAGSWFYYIRQMLNYIIILNINLAIFNLIPVPPLDGSKIFISVLPDKWHYNTLRFENYGHIILLLLLFTGIIGNIIGFISVPLFNILKKLAGL